MSDEMSRRIKELRLSKHMTLEDVGNIVGVGKSTVRKWENGLIENMKRDKIASLAKALGVSPSYLMGWDDQSAATPDLTEDEITILGYFNMLNDYGKEEAVKRVSELSEIDRYKKQPDAQRSNLDVG